VQNTGDATDHFDPHEYHKDDDEHHLLMGGDPLEELRHDVDFIESGGLIVQAWWWLRQGRGYL
jgi:hypothetical protein